MQDDAKVSEHDEGRRLALTELHEEKVGRDEDEHDGPRRNLVMAKGLEHLLIKRVELFDKHKALDECAQNFVVGTGIAAPPPRRPNLPQMTGAVAGGVVGVQFFPVADIEHDPERAAPDDSVDGFEDDADAAYHADPFKPQDAVLHAASRGPSGLFAELPGEAEGADNVEGCKGEECLTVCLVHLADRLVEALYGEGVVGGGLAHEARFGELFFMGEVQCGQTQNAVHEELMLGCDLGYGDLPYGGELWMSDQETACRHGPVVKQAEVMQGEGRGVTVGGGCGRREGRHGGRAGAMRTGIQV